MIIEKGDKPWTPCLASSSSAPPTYSSLPSLPRFPLLEDESVEAGEAREGDVASAAASLHGGSCGHVSLAIGHGLFAAYDFDSALFDVRRVVQQWSLKSTPPRGGEGRECCLGRLISLRMLVLGRVCDRGVTCIYFGLGAKTRMHERVGNDGRRDDGVCVCSEPALLAGAAKSWRRSRRSIGEEEESVYGFDRRLSCGGGG